MPTRRCVSPEAYRRITAAALAALSIIIVTGAAVRLTGSGLGCTDWPNCTEGRFVASLDSHQLIEFVNRVFTGAVSLAVILAVAGSLRRVPYRRDLVWWSLGLVAGVIGQILLGALVVKLELVPSTVIAHFLLSMVLVWNAVVLHHRAGAPDPIDAPAGTAVPDRAAPVGAPAWLRPVWFLVAMAVLVTGTVVTGSGPHGGDEFAERLPFLFKNAARVHGITVMCFLALTVLLVARTRAAGAPRRVQVATWRVLGLLLAQAAIGYVQYLTKVPVVLVGFHIAGATVLWISVVQAALVLRPAPLPRSVTAPFVSSPA